MSWDGYKSDEKTIHDTTKAGMSVCWDEFGDTYYVKVEGDKIKIFGGLGGEIVLGIVGAIELADNITEAAEKALQIAEDLEDEEMLWEIQKEEK